MYRVFLLLTVLLSAQVLATTDDNRGELEDVVEEGSVEAFVAKAITHAKATVKDTSLEAISDALRPYDKAYFPASEQPLPTVLFFHGCSGPTASHEQDWAKRFNDAGIGLVAVDSYKGRGIEWRQACDFKVMTPWQRSADILATIEDIKADPRVDADQLYLAGFSHGAVTIWAALAQASTRTPPIGLPEWPEVGFEQHVQGAFMFYGTCMQPWTTDVDAAMFLGTDDRYIEEETCQAYEPKHPQQAGALTVKIYPGATHTFDHANPNRANIEAGSKYDPDATEDAWKTMLKMIEGNR
ncbi:dienelactone hydrolase family protein [Microbulbifer halophilus]|uniref:Dienelactone hydrolase family protein n=1 Tax=Microbulbifer halophilus TaxID=453963 RepID=A0ABW5ECG8_9GAMM|nr:dienelactone hydrolase family protein [Microbulbifer halophilus]MCW8125238.1 dienelactone hydrolase family protein [Microbulbifer halophilus]